MSDNWQSITEFSHTDDEIQLTILLRTANGAVYVGSWDDDAGYFFTDYLVSGIALNQEIPGRMYDPPVEFKSIY